MANEKSVRAVLSDGMRFAAETASGHSVVMDSTDLADGDNAGASPMELVLVGLAGCTGMDVISILRKMRQDVTSYAVAVRGTQADEHPRVYTDVMVEHSFTGRNLNPDLVRRAVELSETRYCPVGAMLSKTARITHVVTITEE